MGTLQFLQAHQIVLLSLVGLLMLCIGSFLNVVIYRYPLMLESNWRQQCVDYLGYKREIDGDPLSFIKPASHCPTCKKQIAAWQNIPILSYLFLRGRCYSCHKAISILYPMVEILTPLLSIFVVLKFGLTWQSVWGIALTGSLIVLGAIDIKKHILPDTITLPFLWLGLILSLYGIYTTPFFAIFGAVFGYCLLWVVARLFKFIRKKEGMGHGDFKLFAMLGAWFGLSSLLNIILIAASIGIVVGVLLILIKKYRPDEAIPFGPCLAIAGWLHLIYSNSMINFMNRLFT